MFGGGMFQQKESGPAVSVVLPSEIESVTNDQKDNYEEREQHPETRRRGATRPGRPG